MLGIGRLRGVRVRRSVVLVALSLSVAVGSSTVPLTVANAQDPAAVRAAEEIQAARDRANAASQAMFDAESRLDTLELEIAAAEQDLAATEAQADSMRTSLQLDAQRSFVNSGTSIPLLIDLDQANAGITADRQASVARGVASVELDDFDAVMKEVRAQRAELERQQEATTEARERFEDLRSAAEAEVVALAEIERQRLADVAVQRELERQRQAKLAQEAAVAEQAAAAQQAQIAASSSGSSSAPAAGAPAPSDSASGGSSSNASTSGGAQGASNNNPAPAPAPTPAPAPAPAPAPVPASPAPSNAGGIVCPVQGPHAFADTWGAPRSGGRSHEGVDMMASRGTPLVAVESGVANFRNTRLGGKSVGLTGNSGTYYFYAHLDAWSGSSRTVQRGEVIGYVGATGNTTANHLHFEVHPGGGRAVNPYPYVRAVC